MTGSRHEGLLRRRSGRGAVRPPALAAPAAEHDLGLAHLETLVGTRRHADLGEVDVQVAHLAARRGTRGGGGRRPTLGSNLVVPVPRSRAAISPMAASSFSVWYTVLSEIVSICALARGVDRLGRGMGHVALQHTEDALALGRDLAALGAEQRVSSSGDRMTAANVSPTIVS